MGKVNKMKLKAKNAISRMTQQAPPPIIKFKNKPDDGEKISLELHKIRTPQKTIKKKDKSRQKHKNLLLKFAAMKKKHKEEVARRNREKAAIVGDLKPLKDALPSLSELFEMTKKKDGLRTGLLASQEHQQNTDKEEPKKLSARQKLKQKREKFVRQVTSYEKLLQDPEFKSNPREMIAYHIKYTNGLIDT